MAGPLLFVALTSTMRATARNPLAATALPDAPSAFWPTPPRVSDATLVPLPPGAVPA